MVPWKRRRKNTGENQRGGGGNTELIMAKSFVRDTKKNRKRRQSGFGKNLCHCQNVLAMTVQSALMTVFMTNADQNITFIFFWWTHYFYFDSWQHELHNISHFLLQRKMMILHTENVSIKLNTSNNEWGGDWRCIKWRGSSFLFEEQWFRGENRWTNGCLHSQQEVLSDAASAPHPVLVGCQAAPLLSCSPHVCTSTEECDWLSEELRLYDPCLPWRQWSCVLITQLTTSGLSMQVSPSDVHGDKSHAKLDSHTDVNVLIEHGGCAFPKRFIKHSCLHLKRDSSLTQQMPMLSILLLRSLLSCKHLHLLLLYRNNWGVRMCTAWRARPTQN